MTEKRKPEVQILSAEPLTDSSGSETEMNDEDPVIKKGPQRFLSAGIAAGQLPKGMKPINRMENNSRQEQKPKTKNEKEEVYVPDTSIPIPYLALALGIGVGVLLFYKGYKAMGPLVAKATEIVESVAEKE